MKKLRTNSTGLTNRLDFECTIDRISYIQVELRQLTAERDAAVQAAQQTHAEMIAELSDELKAKAALCEKFADEHRTDLLPGKAKSAETPLSRYGFRLGNPTLKTMAKKTWEQVLEMLDEGRPDYVRLTPSVDKETILSDYAQDLVTKEVLASFFIRVVQNEGFFIEPKVDGAEPVKAEA